MPPPLAPRSYINGKPFVVREAERPFSNLEYTGIDRERVEGMEARLKQDVLAEVGCGAAWGCCRLAACRSLQVAGKLVEGMEAGMMQEVPGEVGCRAGVSSGLLLMRCGAKCSGAARGHPELFLSAISQLKSAQAAKQHLLSHLQAAQYGNQILVAHEDDAFQVRGACCGALAGWLLPVQVWAMQSCAAFVLP